MSLSIAHFFLLQQVQVFAYHIPYPTLAPPPPPPPSMSFILFWIMITESVPNMSTDCWGAFTTKKAWNGRLELVARKQSCEQREHYTLLPRNRKVWARGGFSSISGGPGNGNLRKKKNLFLSLCNYFCLPIAVLFWSVKTLYDEEDKKRERDQRMD